MQKAIEVVSKGSGMPHSLMMKPLSCVNGLGIEKKDALNYAIVGCVELTTHGNNLGGLMQLCLI